MVRSASSRVSNRNGKGSGCSAGRQDLSPAFSAFFGFGGPSTGGSDLI
jgi:hypothetical protein